MASIEHYDEVLQDITRYAHRYTPEKPVAWERARAALLDALGCAIETVHVSADCSNLLGPIVSGTTVPQGFRLPGTSFCLDPVKGAFDMGTLIRYLDHNDAVGGAEWGHPSDNIGAILSVADWLSRKDASLTDPQKRRTLGPAMCLRTLLVALIKAYEIQGCLQELNSFNAVGLDHTILVKIASTAVVSWLLGSTELATVAALSHVFQDGHPLRTFRQAPNVGPRKGWAAGDACMRAVHLALLAKGGQPGAPTVLTNKNWGFNNTLFRGNEVKLRRPYASYIVENLAFKVVPAEGHGISAVEAALQLNEALMSRGLDVLKDVTRIDFRTQKPAFVIINKSGPLRGFADRDHCLQYMIAVTLLKGSMIEAQNYADDSAWASDQRVESLRANIHVKEDPAFTSDYYNEDKKSCSTGLTATLTCGKSLPEQLVEHPIGSVKRLETLSAVKAKFRRNMALAFVDEKIARIERMAYDDGASVHDFVDLFWKGP